MELKITITEPIKLGAEQNGLAVGPAGEDGTNGTDGVGVPAAGTTGQVLKKATDTDYDTAWEDESGGGKFVDGTDPLNAVYMDGNVGIGTIAPDVPLHVIGAVNIENTSNPLISFIPPNTITSSQIIAYKSGWGEIVIRSKQTSFHIGGSEKAVLSSSGNFGIGQTSPDTLLHVAGAITQQPLSADPSDPDAGNSVTWVSDGTGSGDAGDVMMKINVGGTTKTTTLIDYSAI